mmetsp:Transcript_10744/g.20269  ORF Transcript_10744/g.20269 Transcript_10744/m.20269 type:complete len:201 (-) Transcript_10744:190-792(-)
MVASPPWPLWYSSASLRGYSQMTSAFSMKNGSPVPSSRSFLAMAKGPAVPMGVSSSEHVILIPSFASYSLRKFIMTLGWYAMARMTWSTPALFSASIWCRIIGLFAKSTRGLGTDNVSGLSLVPKPPTKINAFISSVSSSVSCLLLKSKLHFTSPLVVLVVDLVSLQMKSFVVHPTSQAACVSLLKSVSPGTFPPLMLAV